MTTVRVGLCAWTDKGLIDLWYPPSAKSAEARLRYYAEQFDTVEVNSSYYAIPEVATAQRWADRTPDGFTFHVKAFGLMTGHRVRPEQLPPDLRPLVDQLTARGHVEPSEVLEERVFRRFRDMLEPLAEAGRLGGVLMQYPPSFRMGGDAAARIEQDRDRLRGFEMLTEFRQRDWLSERFRDETIDLLRRLGVTYVAVDAPRVSSPNVAQSVPAATSDTAYIRFHGRNAATWNARGSSASERFDHYYTEDELRQWVEPLRELALSGVSRIYAMFNTNNADQGPVNANLLRDILDRSGVPVADPPGPSQGELFE